MGLYTSYYLYQKYEQREGQDSIPCTPNVYSIDGQGTMEKVIKLDDDPECGYTPEPTEPIYRWYQIPISEGYVCDECPELQYRWVESGTTCVGYDKWNRSIEQYSEDGGTTWNNTNPPVYSATSLIEVDSTDCGVLYRWIDLNPSTDYYCSGTTKYYKQQKQKSYDGSTWENVTPAEYQWGGTAETQSTDCGYVPPVTTFKFKATYNDGTPSYSLACDGNTTLTSGNTYPNGWTRAMVSAEIGNCVSEIGREAFVNAFSLSSINIPSGVTSIGYGAFWNATGLTSVTLPNTLTSIDTYAFYIAKSLTSIDVPDSVTSIGQQAFSICQSLTSVTIPSNITTLPQALFSGCNSLKRVNSNTDGVVNVPTNVTVIPSDIFGSCKQITSVNISTSVTTIGGGAFDQCHNLRRLNSNTNGIINLPNTITSIGAAAFEWCYRVTSINIPPNITSIEDYTFRACSGVTSFDIPSSVTSIGGGAFYNCKALQSVIIRATTPPSINGWSSSNWQAFGNTNNCPILVPSQSVSAYQSASGWSNYSSRIQAIP